MKRIICYEFRKFIRRLCNKKTQRDKWILIDNIFNDHSEPVDNFSFFLYLLNNTNENAFYVIQKSHVRYAELKKKYGEKIIGVTKGRLSLPLIKSLENAKYILDSFQVLSNKFNIGDILCTSKIHYIYTEHGINFFKTGFIERSNVISDENFTEILFSNKNEKKLLNEFYNYPEDRIIYSGLPRWDNIKKSEQAILIYFTFRSYLLKSKQDYDQFEYYRNLKTLLNSERLKNLTRKYSFKIYFALHHEAERFTKDAYEGIDVIQQNDIGSIKNSAALLVTDFSSMCFDFMVADKPVIFFRLDATEKRMDEESKVNNDHVEQLNEYIYNITYDCNKTIDFIEHYAERNFILEEDLVNKNNYFFTKREKFCKDIYEKIKKLKTTDLYHDLRTPIGKIISLSRTKDVRCIGLSKPESNGRWSCSDQVLFYLNIPQMDRDVVALFDLHSIIDIDCTVDIFQNIGFVGNIFTDPKRNKISILISKDLIYNRKGRIKIRFKIKMPVKPIWVKDSKDARYLGIFFKSLKLI